MRTSRFASALLLTALLAACGSQAASPAPSSSPSAAASSAAKPAASASAPAKPAALIPLKVGTTSLAAPSAIVPVTKDAGLYQKYGLNAELAYVEGSKNLLAALFT